MKNLLLIFGVFILLTAGCQPSIESSNRIIADSVKSYIVRTYTTNDHHKIKIDTLVILKTNLISQKETIGVLMKQSEDEYSWDKTIVDEKWVFINSDKRSIEMYKGFLEKGYNTAKETIDDEKKIKEDSLEMMRYYSELDTPQKTLSKITKYRDSLSLLLAYIDTTKRDNYLSLVHFSISQPSGKYEMNIWAYLDKKYNVVCEKDFKKEE